jgi:hypothetical protein
MRRRGTAATPEARGDSGGVENKDEVCPGVFSREKMVPGKHAYPTIRRMKVSRRKGRGCFTLDIVRSRPYLHACTISSGSGIIFITEPPRRGFRSPLKGFKGGRTMRVGRAEWGRQLHLHACVVPAHAALSRTVSGSVEWRLEG